MTTSPRVWAGSNADGEVRLWVDGSPTSLTPNEAHELARNLTRVADRITPATEEHLAGLAPVAEVTGRSVEQVAAELGIDLATATVTDVFRMTANYADAINGVRA